MWHINLSVNQVRHLDGFPNPYDIELLNVVDPFGTLDFVEVMMARSMAIVYH